MGLAGPFQLAGPTVNADVGRFRAAFGGAPAERALAALARFDKANVCGDVPWRPVTVANDAPTRHTEPLEAGALPPPLCTQLLVREPEGCGSGIRIGGRR